MKAALLRLHSLLAGRRGLATAVAGLLTLLALLTFRTLDFSEDAAALLPDRGSRAADDFRLLAESPLARTLSVHLRAEDGADLEAGFRALETGLKSPLIPRIIAGPGRIDPLALKDFLAERAPYLLAEADYAALDARLAGLGEQLSMLRTRLASPEGLGQARLAAADPLDLGEMLLQKLAALRIGSVEVRGGRFVAPSGRDGLILLETAFGPADSAKAMQLTDMFAQVRSSLPPGLSAALVGFAPHAAANAGAVKRDMLVLSVASFVLVAAIFFGAMRGAGGFITLATPLLALVCSVGLGSLIHPRPSGLALGFSSVLLGVTVDFGIQLHFAFRRRTGGVGRVLSEAFAPIFFAFATSLACFAALFASDAPVQRELALFASVGLGIAWMLAMTIVPLWPPKIAPAPAAQTSFPSDKPARRLPALVWLCCLGAAGFGASRIHIDARLSTLGVRPEATVKAEETLRRTFGFEDAHARIFVAAKDLDKALAGAEALVVRSGQPFPNPLDLLSSDAEAVRRLARWNHFWAERGEFRDRLVQTGREHGFSERAFAPFLARLDAPARPPGLDDWRGLGLGDALAQSVPEDGPSRLILPAPENPALAALFGNDGAFATDGAELRLVSQRRFDAEMGRALGDDALRCGLIAGIATLTLVLIQFRAIKPALVTLAAPATGILATLGLMTAFDIGVNLFHICGFVFVLGLSVDYGIFMVCKRLGSFEHEVDKAVYVSLGTTLAGFGALLLARHPALVSIGVAVVSSMTVAAAYSLWVIPALLPQTRKP